MSAVTTKIKRNINTMKEEQNVKKASVPKAFAGVYYTAIALVAVLLLIFSLVTYYFLPASTSSSGVRSKERANAF